MENNNKNTYKDFYKERLVPLYKILNNLFMANYACLNRSHQMIGDKKSDSSFSLLDLLGLQESFEKEDNDLLSDFARIRNNQFDFFNDTSTNYQLIDELYAEFEYNKGVLMHYYNKYFGQNYAYEDCFDGFTIKNEWFNGVIKQCRNFEGIKDAGPDLIELISAYLNFINYLVAFYTNRAFYEILEQLKFDVSNLGYPTPYYQKPISDNISLISRDQLKHLVRISYKKYLDVRTKEQVSRKKYEREKHNYDNNTPKNRSMTFLNLNFLEDEHIKWKNHVVDAEHLYMLCKELQNRLVATGKLPYKPTLSHTIRFNLNPLYVDKTYIHEYEKEHIIYLCECLTMENPFMEKSNENSK